MTNHTKQFERVEETFKKLEEEYKIFKKNISYENKCNLKQKINTHREALNNLMSSINNIFLK